ncbi:MAG: PocR ligand-binding domain-containing protein [Clostridia bacterium]|nr:PocR ligand-binding domain-containing protein [Clostridia bacterium]
MSIYFDVKKINSVLLDFNTATGVRIDLLDADFTPISYSECEANDYCNLIQSTKEGKSACAYSDECLLNKCKKAKATQHQLCHAGLIDTAVPIVHNDEIIGYLLFGQMRSEEALPKLTKYFERLGLNAKDTYELYSSIPIINNDKIESISSIATILVKHILLENMLSTEPGENVERAVVFINNNLSSELSVSTVCKSANISKSVLYKKLHERFGCTLSEYINRRRINESIKLLHSTSLSVDEIAQRVGFSSASYYSKTFKKQTGVSPLKYRKS